MSAARQKGTAFESSLIPLLREFYPDAKRNPLAGTKDVGDFNLPGEQRYTLEAKNRAVTALPAWLAQARRSAHNLNPDAVGVVVWKRKGTTDPSLQYVAMELSDFLKLVAA